MLCKVVLLNPMSKSTADCVGSDLTDKKTRSPTTLKLEVVFQKGNISGLSMSDFPTGKSLMGRMPSF